MTNPSLSLLVKIGSALVHAAELRAPHARPDFDGPALDTILTDSDVRKWVAEMSAAGFLPVPRGATLLSEGAGDAE